MRYQSYGPGLRNLAAASDGQGHDIVVDKPSSVKARQFKVSRKDILKFIFT